MLYHLLFPLAEQFAVFNVFRYITFRAAYATVTLHVEKIQPLHISRNRPVQPFEWVQGHGVAGLYAE